MIELQLHVSSFNHLIMPENAEDLGEVQHVAAVGGESGNSRGRGTQRGGLNGANRGAAIAAEFGEIFGTPTAEVEEAEQQQ